MKNKTNSLWALVLMLCLPGYLVAGEPIIDVHAHVFHDIGDLNWAGPDLPANASQAEKQADKFRRTQAVWDKHNVELAFTSGDLDRVLEWQKKDKRVMGGLGIDATQASTKPVMDEIRRLAKEGKIKVLGETAFQYFGIGPDNPLADIWFSLAEELDLPVALHMGSGFLDVHSETPLYRVSAGDPMLLEEALIKHPEMRIYIMHAGWPFLDNMIAIMNTYPQVYVDVADLNHHFPIKEFHFYLKRLVDAGFGERIMFGSDSYSPNPDHKDDTYHYISFEERYARGIQNIEDAEFLTKQQKRDIFYNNAVRFFRLEK